MTADLLAGFGVELGDLNLQEECEFQAAELSGLAELILSLTSKWRIVTRKEWSNELCEYLNNMVSEVCTDTKPTFRFLLGTSETLIIETCCALFVNNGNNFRN